jgi:hypothetical protein
MLVEVGNEWTFNQSSEFIVFGNLKFPNLKLRMNNIDSLSHVSKFKGNEDKMDFQ